MHVRVRGDHVEVFVSDTGMFHDRAMKYYARTLKGLETKMNANPDVPSSTTPIVVERVRNPYQQGAVIGKGKAKYNTSYKVRWDNGTTNVVSISDLRKPMTPHQRATLKDLSDAAEQAEEASATASQNFDDYEQQFSIIQDLYDRFGS